MVWLGNPWWVLFFDGFVRSLKAYSPQTYGWWAGKDDGLIGVEFSDAMLKVSDWDLEFRDHQLPKCFVSINV